MFQITLANTEPYEFVPQMARMLDSASVNTTIGNAERKQNGHGQKFLAIHRALGKSCLSSKGHFSKIIEYLRKGFFNSKSHFEKIQQCRADQKVVVLPNQSGKQNDNCDNINESIQQKVNSEMNFLSTFVAAHRRGQSKRIQAPKSTHAGTKLLNLIFETYATF